MKIGIIGAGYVGLTTGICLASMKHEISIFDVNKEWDHKYFKLLLI